MGTNGAGASAVVLDASEVTRNNAQASAYVQQTILTKEKILSEKRLRVGEERKEDFEFSTKVLGNPQLFQVLSPDSQDMVRNKFRKAMGGVREEEKEVQLIVEREQVREEEKQEEGQRVQESMVVNEEEKEQRECK